MRLLTTDLNLLATEKETSGKSLWNDLSNSIWLYAISKFIIFFRWKEKENVLIFAVNAMLVFGPTSYRPICTTYDSFYLIPFHVRLHIRSSLFASVDNEHISTNRCRWFCRVLFFFQLSKWSLNNWLALTGGREQFSTQTAFYLRP